MSTATIATIAAVIASPASEATATEAPKPVKLECVKGETEARILENLRSLHHLVLLGLSEVGEKPLFNDKFEACNTEDYKCLHQQARVILSQADKVRWTNYTKSIQSALQGVIDTYMNKARTAKAKIDAMLAECEDDSDRAMIPAFPNTVKVPFTAFKAAFPAGKSDTDIIKELHKLYNGQVGNKATKGQKEVKPEDVYVNFAFVPAPAPKSAQEPKVEEESPKSGEKAVDVAAAAE